MNLTSVKYQDSCIYIGLDGSNGHETRQESLKEVKSVYAVYKIKAHDNFVKDTILIRKKDISIENKEIIVKFELNQLRRPEECEIEIVSLKIIYFSGKREVLTINKSYRLLEIRAHPRISSNKENGYKKKNLSSNKENREALSMTQEVIVSYPESNKKEEFTVIQKKTSLSAAVSEVESRIEGKFNAQTKKLEMDITQLCYETMDLLLTSLPQPQLAEDYRSSDAMIQSIRRYINSDLLQKELEEGESA